VTVSFAHLNGEKRERKKPRKIQKLDKKRETEPLVGFLLGFFFGYWVSGIQVSRNTVKVSRSVDFR